MPRAVSDVHVAGRAPPAAAHRQRRSPAHAASAVGIGRDDDARWERFERRGTGSRGTVRSIRATVVRVGRARVPAPRAEAAGRPARGPGRPRPRLDWIDAACEIDVASLKPRSSTRAIFSVRPGVERQRRQEGRAIPEISHFERPGPVREMIQRLTVSPADTWPGLADPGVTPAAVAVIGAYSRSAPRAIAPRADDGFTGGPRDAAGRPASEPRREANVFHLRPTCRELGRSTSCSRAGTARSTSPRSRRPVTKRRRLLLEPCCGAGTFPAQPRSWTSAPAAARRPFPSSWPIPRLSCDGRGEDAQGSRRFFERRSGSWSLATDVETARFEELLARPELHEAFARCLHAGRPHRTHGSHACRRSCTRRHCLFRGPARGRPDACSAIERRRQAARSSIPDLTVLRSGVL